MDLNLPEEILLSIQDSIPCRDLQIRQLGLLLGVGSLYSIAIWETDRKLDMELLPRKSYHSWGRSYRKDSGSQLNTASH